MRKRHGGAHGNHIARKERQFHAGVALSDAVAHGGRAAGKLGGGAVFEGFFFNPGGENLQRLVGGYHVVISRHNAQIGGFLLLQFDFHRVGGSGKSVCQIGAAQLAALEAAGMVGGADALQIGGAGGAAALDNALGYGSKDGVEGGRVHYCVPFWLDIVKGQAAEGWGRPSEWLFL